MKLVQVMRLKSLLYGALALLGATAAHAVALEVQTFSLGNTSGATGFRTVSFASTVFQDNGVTPLVFAIPTTQGVHPCAFRIDNVTQTGFDIACVEPSGDDGPHTGISLHYIAIEPGVHSIPATIGGSATTVTMAAGSVSTSMVQHGCSSAAICGTEGSTAFTYGTTFSSAPALLLQIQSLNSETGTPPGGVSVPFLTSTVVEDGSGNPLISTTGASVALERSETQQGTVSAETIGWLAVEETLSGGSAACATLDFSTFSGPSSVSFQAVLTGAVIDGWSDGCNNGEGASFVSGCFSSAPTVVATKRTHNENDGGWLRRCTGGFTATTARFTVDEDRNSGAGNEGDTERNHVAEEASVLAFGTNFFTPVTLAWFRSTPTPTGVRVEWATATEVGNLGFMLWERVGDSWLRVGDRLIPSHAVDSTAPQRYSYETSAVSGYELRLTDLSIRNRTTDHGPFRVGLEYGREPDVQDVDWAAIGRQRAARARRGAASAAKGPSSEAEIRLSADGLYRVTFEQLQAAGLDWTGVPLGDIALTLAGRPQRIRVQGGDDEGFGPGAFVEFYGAAVADSLYTRTRVYRLAIDGGRARRVLEERPTRTAGEPVRAHDFTLAVDQNSSYSFASPNGDPWYAERLLSAGETVAADFLFSVDRLEASTGGRLEVDIWGVTDFPTAPDHHARLELNGQWVWEEWFDGLVAVPIDLDLAPGVLREGENVLTLTLLGDTGAEFDLVNFDRFSVTYRRELAAPSGGLDFHSSGPAFEVAALPDDEVTSYRLTAADPPQLAASIQLLVRPGADGFTARSGRLPDRSNRYLIATAGAIRTPDEIRPAPALPPLDRSAADYLIITHADFSGGLGDLIAAREAQGLRVRVIDVDELYARFSYGLVDPMAIQSYVALAYREMGARFVLLVGSDSYDYFDYTGTGSISFVPTRYARTGEIVSFAPSDALLADVDDDEVPDLAIGRLPVRSPDELAEVIAKTLAYERSGSRGAALFVADDDEPMASFSQMSDGLAGYLDSGWSLDRAYLGELGLEATRQRIVDTVEGGVGLVSYFGHSGPGVWTFDGLFATSDAAELRNEEPTVVLQWGCWNTYFVEPAFNTLAHGFLVSGTHGAAAVLGAGTLTTPESEQALGPLVLGAATRPGATLGQAIQDAKTELVKTRPDLLDVILGWNLLGDPALMLQP